MSRFDLALPAFLCSIILLFSFSCGERSRKLAPYRNPELSIEKRVDDLLSRMSLDEKIVQMQCIWNEKSTRILNDQGALDPDKASRMLPHGIGQIGRLSDAGDGKDAYEMAELANAIQSYFARHTRLGIPVIIHEECLHGHAAKGATSFPQPIALVSSWDTELVEQVYGTTALEARTRGSHQALTPVVDVARDPRWGRVEETFGEDPYLVGEMGMAAVRGFQGSNDFTDGKSLLATLKHFAAHAQPESGQNCAPANLSERILREVHLYPFQKAVQECKVVSIMASYNEIDGVPSHANAWLLRKVLRDEWGFEGFVVSDYYAITELFERDDFRNMIQSSMDSGYTFMPGQYVAGNLKEAASLAIKAGVNIELPEPLCYTRIKELIQDGSIREEEIDALVRPMLSSKFRLGLFENPYVDAVLADSVAGCDSHIRLAREAAQKSIVLLKNENNMLPLEKEKIRRIAVIGPNADREMLGGYSGDPDHVVTLLDGIRKKAGNKIIVEYAEGCKLTIGGSWSGDEVKLAGPGLNQKLIRDAEMLAAQSDVVIMAIGGNEQTSREAWAPDHLGDRSNLDLIGDQMELVERVLARNRKVVVVLNNGRPLTIQDMDQLVPAMLECWYLGQESGHAIADVLFGDYNPGGKLPITFPRSAGQIPAYYNHKPFDRRGYAFVNNSPLYPFGHGLSYTNFRISDLELDKYMIGIKDTVIVTVKITNTGHRAGDEVIQLYIRDRISSVTRPVKELKGFRRVHLEAGESARVTLTLTPGHLSFWNIDMNYGVEKGEFQIMVGNNSVNLLSKTLTVK